jgi:hypothetical protein
VVAEGREGLPPATAVSLPAACSRG